MKDYVDVECEASVSFETTDGFPSATGTSNRRASISPAGTGSEIHRDRLRSLLHVDPIIRAKIEDVECESSDDYFFPLLPWFGAGGGGLPWLVAG